MQFILMIAAAVQHPQAVTFFAWREVVCRELSQTATSALAELARYFLIRQYVAWVAPGVCAVGWPCRKS